MNTDEIRTNVGGSGGADDGVGPPPRDELDGLLRTWHETKREQAAAGRDRLLAALKAEDRESASGESAERSTSRRDVRVHDGSGRSLGHTLRRIVVNRYSPLVLAAVMLAAIVPFMLPAGRGTSVASAAKLASNIVMAPEGGLLEAFDADGLSLGPCVLKHTDVNAEITGRFARVTVRQTYSNPHPDKVEAVYTFPLSHRSGVDRMTMTIGDRVIVGEVKERQQARRIYEAARDSGRVASLLEQERPNVFTQSVANIEPGASIDIEISYVELVQERDGAFAFEFPTVVGPRYVPGEVLSPTIGVGRDRAGGVEAKNAARMGLPPELKARRGLVLLGPASVTRSGAARGHSSAHTSTGAGGDALLARLKSVVPIQTPADGLLADVRDELGISYADGSGERMRVFAGNIVEVGGRFGYCPPMDDAVRDRDVHATGGAGAESGAPFASDTNQVPDASKITPMPTRPGVRAGHDISIRVNIDTGGAGIKSITSGLHSISRTELSRRLDGMANRVSVSLANLSEIPNRDFVLSWSPTRDTIEPSVFTHTGSHGNFFLLQLEPPARVEDAQAVARELVFVIDTSGSMSGIPIAKSREVVAGAIAAMRPQDTFNVITFAGETRILWQSPRPSTAENRREATEFVTSLKGGGGTEMMKAINAALEQRPAAGGIGDSFAPGVDGREESLKRLRIVMFLTDGLIGNDHAIIDAIKRNRGTTRVFSFGIGTSVNRYLLDSMASAGGGEAEFVLVGQNAEAAMADADAAVKRFNTRTSTPVLTDIRVTLSDGLKVLDTVPTLDAALPDLFDAKPLMFLGRYAASGAGTVTISGRTASGPWERRVEVVLPEKNEGNTSLPTLWAREKIGALLATDLAALQLGRTSDEVRRQVIQLGETFGVMSPFTSFVAVDKLRVTIAGVPRLVHVPVEVPDSTSFEGIFGSTENIKIDEREVLSNIRLGKPALNAGVADALVAQNRMVMRNQSDNSGSTPPAAAATSDLRTGLARAGSRGDTSGGTLDALAAKKSSPQPTAAPSVAPMKPAGRPESGSRVGRPTSSSQVSVAAETDRAAGSMSLGKSDVKDESEFEKTKFYGVSSAEPESSVVGGRDLAKRRGAESQPTGLFYVDDRKLEGNDADGGVSGSVLAVPEVLNSIAAAQLALDRRVADARLLACELSNETVVNQNQRSLRQQQASQRQIISAESLCDVLRSAKDDTELSPEQRARVVAIQVEAARELEEVVKLRTLRRRLDDGLFAMVAPSAEASMSPHSALGSAKSTRDLAGAGADEGMVAVVVLVGDPSESMVARLRAMGIAVDSVNMASRVIACRVKRTMIEPLALLEGVRRVEQVAE